MPSRDCRGLRARRRASLVVWVALVVLPLAGAPAVLAQQAVVQALPDPAAADLSDALRRLARAPQDLSALIDAGHAAVRLGQIDSAEAFFTRAEAIAPEDGRVITGKAQVALGRRDAPAAIALFDRAEASGEILDPFAGERGLAYDLVGQNIRAQVLYGQSLSRKEDDEIIRRLALSYAISGDQDASDATLLPLLQARDLAAYRTRAFALAIAGRPEEALSITNTMLPPRIASSLEPYLRYMQRLTRAQQAAAANFGIFPHPTEMGTDPPQIAALSAAEPARIAAPRGADTRLIPGGATLGGQRTAAPSGAELPPVVRSTPAPRAVQAPRAVPGPGAAPIPPQPVASSADLAAATAPRPAPPPIQQQPARVAPAPTPAPAPVLAPTPTPAPAPPPSRVGLADAFADFDLSAAPPTGPRSADAVDITSIVPKIDAPLVREPPVRQLPVNPSRHWVQLATGQDVGKFRFDWRRIAGSAGGLLDGQNPFYAAWGANNRLIIGPFASEAEAQKLVTGLAVKGLSTFVFTSTSGERVIPLP